MLCEVCFVYNLAIMHINYCTRLLVAKSAATLFAIRNSIIPLHCTATPSCRIPIKYTVKNTAARHLPSGHLLSGYLLYITFAIYLLSATIALRNICYPIHFLSATFTISDICYTNICYLIYLRHFLSETFICYPIRTFAIHDIYYP